MRFETFFEQFDLFAGTPNGVAKMRELLLLLAVTGRLVPQDPRDEPACAELRLMEAERTLRVDASEIKSRAISPLDESEVPYELPPNWAWVRLAQVGYELGQKVPDRRFTYVDVGAIDPEKGVVSDRVETLEPNEAPSRARKLVARGTVIYSTVRPYLLNVAIVEREYDPEPIASTAFGILHPFAGISNRYLFYWLRSAPFTAYVLAAMKGMAYPAINDEKFYNGLIPLPPFAEQKRIAAKLDELMALCDRLEAQQQERQVRHAALARASLARFAGAPTPVNLDFLFDDSYAVEPSDLRKTVLTLAVHGKLVPQDSNDEAAGKLLETIAIQRAKLLDSDLLRETKPCRQFTSDEAPHEIPETWAWTMLGEVTDIGTGSTPSRTEASFWMDGTIPWITSGSTSRSPITEGDEFVTPAAVKAHRLRVYPPGTLLVALYGQGKTRGQVAALAIPATINQACAAICPLDGTPPMQGYLKLVLKKQYDEMRALSAGGAQPNLNVQKVKEVFVPLPPLAEQRRIVAKVKHLMVLVDRLEADIGSAQAASARLLDALVGELTGRRAVVCD
jgi:type I restriction enzyme S subunit